MRRSQCRLGRFVIVSLVLHILAVEFYYGIDCQESKKTKIDLSKVRKLVKPIVEKLKKGDGSGSKIVSSSRKFGSSVMKSLTANTLEFLESFDKDNVFEQTLKETDDLLAGFLDNFLKNSKEDEADDQDNGDDQENGQDQENGEDQENGHDQENEDDEEANEESEGETEGKFYDKTSDSEKLLGAEQKHKDTLDKGQSSASDAEHTKSKSEDLLPELKSELEDVKEEFKSKLDHIKEELETKLEDLKGNKSPTFGKPKEEDKDILESLEDKIKQLEEDLASIKEKSRKEVSGMIGSSQKVTKGFFGESEENEYLPDKEEAANSPNHSESKDNSEDEQTTESEDLFKDFKNEQNRSTEKSTKIKKTKYHKKLNSSDENPKSSKEPSEHKQEGPITLSFLRDMNVKFSVPVKVSNSKSLPQRKASKFRKWLHPQKPRVSSQDHKSQPPQQVNESQDHQLSLHLPKQDDPKLTHQLQTSNSPLLIKSFKKEEKHHTADREENQDEHCTVDCEPFT